VKKTNLEIDGVIKLVGRARINIQFDSIRVGDIFMMNYEDGSSYQAPKGESIFICDSNDYVLGTMIVRPLRSYSY
jgi:hypothetical protein